MVVHSVSTVSEWEALASATFVPVHVESPVERFMGTLDHRGDHEWGVTAIRNGAGRVSRTNDLLSSSPDDMALFSVQVRGTSSVEQDGRVAHLRPGDGVLYVTRGTYTLTFPEAAELAILQVPVERLGLTDMRVREMTARTLPVRKDAGLRTFARVARSLFTDRPVIDDQREALRVATEILGSSLSRRGGGAARPRSHSALFAAFDRIIHDRLADPRLDVSALASAENVSPRTVHAVFADHGTTPAAYIRSVRMQRARRLLTSTHLPLVDIAVHCGSTDPSIFSRTFRRDAGMTPSAYRQRSRDL
ncbi:AraC-like DNA-binding protein [Leifsonia sp. AK011]|uniref:helix-turn-helix domain-containing protein n=1 Tax=Leifsonia sp. AK011 TaxID=2723075 RepID=UPI0015C77934|nr:AraC family transcriptional regulator [Leifsonia sp. AK011]NYF10395.1 AraC-like DNA-binding protein [Leifsonia sp. AK011]